MSPSVESTREPIEVPGASVERVHRPADVDALSALLAECHAKQKSVLVCGGRTRLAQANRAERLAAAISLEGLAGIDVFEPDEGVVHARAGTPIRALRAVVAAEGWELPLDPPGESTTVGGAIASAAVGPRAHAFGRVADAVLGLELVGADGTVSKCGGRVVKNVTGYDLAKLYTGSFGSLAVVTGAWLRLRPQPACRAVLMGRVQRDPATFERARVLARATSVRAFVWNESPDASGAEIVVELGGSEAGVAWDRESLERELSLDCGDSDAVDHQRDGRTQAASRTAVGFRARVVPTQVGDLREHSIRVGIPISIDVGAGVVLGRVGSIASDALEGSGRGIPGGGDRTLGGPAPFARLRERTDRWGGHMRFEWMPTAWHDSLDVFGEEPGTRALVAALKQRFDPRRILNPGRFVAGT